MVNLNEVTLKGIKINVLISPPQSQNMKHSTLNWQYTRMLTFVQSRSLLACDSFTNPLHRLNSNRIDSLFGRSRIVFTGHGSNVIRLATLVFDGYFLVSIVEYQNCFLALSFDKEYSFGSII